MKFKFIILFIAFQSCTIDNSTSNSDWKMHVIDNSSSGADGVRLAEVNADGLMDIATGWEEGGFTKVYLHPGYSNVTSKWPSVRIGETPSVEDAVFCDLDDDGNVDVISSTEGQNRRIYFHWAPKNSNDYLDSTQWITEILPASDGLMQRMFALPIQLDNKNGIDIIAGAKGEGAQVGWFESPENPRSLTDWKWHPVTDASWIMSIFTSDMDSDGDMDIVIADRKPGLDNGVRWLENPGMTQDNVDGEWQSHFIGARDKEVMFMDMKDLDGDDLKDVIVCERTDQKIYIWKRIDDSGLNWQEYTISLPDYTGHAKAVKVGDITGDGINDIVLSTNTGSDDSKEGILILSFEEAGNLNKYSWYPLSGNIGYKFDRLELLDLDGDGDLDVLTCEENYGENSEGLGVIWYENPFK